MRVIRCIGILVTVAAVAVTTSLPAAASVKVCNPKVPIVNAPLLCVVVDDGSGDASGAGVASVVIDNGNGHARGDGIATVVVDNGDGNARGWGFATLVIDNGNGDTRGDGIATVVVDNGNGHARGDGIATVVVDNGDGNAQAPFSDLAIAVDPGRGSATANGCRGDTVAIAVGAASQCAAR